MTEKFIVGKRYKSSSGDTAECVAVANGYPVFVHPRNPIPYVSTGCGLIEVKEPIKLKRWFNVYLDDARLILGNDHPSKFEAETCVNKMNGEHIDTIPFEYEYTPK